MLTVSVASLVIGPACGGTYWHRNKKTYLREKDHIEIKAVLRRYGGGNVLGAEVEQIFDPVVSSLYVIQFSIYAGIYYGPMHL